MNSEVARQPEIPRESFGDLLSQLASNSAALVRDEIDLAKQELREKFKALRTGAVTVIVGAAITFVAFAILCSAAVIGLASFVGWGMSALVVGAGVGLIGGIVGLAGMRQLRRTNLKPEKTIQTLKGDQEWLKEMT